ncbi:hypothetical protein C9374_014628 [Naegleria lovaniensis]|uniref:Uncharacterized protein n=1 Tax=Naegleria lovaniensis TaxID=51637 RepID=A0AA88KPA7_NAELO|nr:uncharacterized protein C9374_014628 [Naegleria lovaniensis]KAG2389228.1 hypothetical protein C9374_014628 [Naegleria lovaniensis]
MSPSPFTHPFIQVIMHLTSPVTSNLFVFFSFKVNHWGKIKASLLASKLLRTKPRMASSSVASSSTTTIKDVSSTTTNPTASSRSQ